jgi:hypothetical protein
MNGMKKLVLAISLAASAMMSGCITSPGPGGGPAPVGQVDAARLYTGQWHEIAFRPNWLLEGCVAGITRYTPKDTPNQVAVRDSSSVSKDLAHCIATLSRHPEMRITLGRSASKYASENYKESNYTSSMNLIYIDAVHRHRIQRRASGQETGAAMGY